MSSAGKVFKPGMYVTMFTDASYCHQTKAAGWAVWIKYGAHPHDQTVRLVGACRRIHDSMHAEYVALEEGLKALEKIPLEGKIVVVQSDCTGALAAIETSHLVRVHGALSVTKKHVKGHQGLKTARSAVNTWCDAEAKDAMRSLRNSILQERQRTPQPGSSTSLGWEAPVPPRI